MMTFLIQRSNRRDSLAVQAKLDELLRSHKDARGELADLDDEEPEEIEKHRKHERAKA
jgi:low affinity Fe/Cu permease